MWGGPVGPLCDRPALWRVWVLACAAAQASLLYALLYGEPLRAVMPPDAAMFVLSCAVLHVGAHHDDRSVAAPSLSNIYK